MEDKPTRETVKKSAWTDRLLTPPVWFAISGTCFILLLITDWTGPGIENKPPVWLVAGASLIAPGVIYFMVSLVAGILGATGFFGYAMTTQAWNNPPFAYGLALILLPIIVISVIQSTIIGVFVGLWYIVLFFWFVKSEGGWSLVVMIIISLTFCFSIIINT